MSDYNGIPKACCSLSISGVDQERLIAMFKALGNPIRFEIMKFLVTHPGSITSDIVDYLPIAQVDWRRLAHAGCNVA